MNIEDLKKQYETAPEIVKVFNTLIDVVISNYYQSKNTYDESINLNTIKNINFSIKPEIKEWHINLIEPDMMKIINKTHDDWEKYDKLKEDYNNEFEYLCYTMSELKQFIHTDEFLKTVYSFLNKDEEE